MTTFYFINFVPRHSA